MALSVKIKETTHKILSGRKRLQILQDVAFYGVFLFCFVFLSSTGIFSQ